MRMQGSENLNLKTRGTPMSLTPVIQLRGCMVEGMRLCKIGENTPNHYIRRVKTLSTFHRRLRRSKPAIQPPDTPK